MKYFDFTLPTPAENLACDEALLELCEEGSEAEILRFWEPNEPFVVVGYANQAAKEVNLEACESHGIPVYRRCSGGGTVVQGPGCLNFSVVLRIPANETGPLSGIASTNSFVLGRQQTALEPLLKAPVQIRGQTDLAMRDLKFSGNAQRRLRHALIFHGTFLLGFDLNLIEQLLPMPSKQPDYRQDRGHKQFLTNLNLSAAEVKAALRKAWGADEVFAGPPTKKIGELVSAKYSMRAWNFKF